LCRTIQFWVTRWEKHFPCKQALRLCEKEAFARAHFFRVQLLQRDCLSQIFRFEPPFRLFCFFVSFHFKETLNEIGEFEGPERQETSQFDKGTAIFRPGPKCRTTKCRTTKCRTTKWRTTKWRFRRNVVRRIDVVPNINIYIRIYTIALSVLSLPRRQDPYFSVKLSQRTLVSQIAPGYNLLLLFSPCSVASQSNCQIWFCSACVHVCVRVCQNVASMGSSA
jgi:hypothetical protein